MRNILTLDRIVTLSLALLIALLLFGNPRFALMLALGAGLFFLIFSWILSLVYRWVF